MRNRISTFAIICFMSLAARSQGWQCHAMVAFLTVASSSRRSLVLSAWYNRKRLTMFSTPSPATTTTTTTTTSSTSSTAAASSPSSSSEVVPFVKPSERIVRPILPVVYCYDHCPFCVRVRFAMGLKNIKHRLHFLANDDIATPTALVGKKISPILEWKEPAIVNESGEPESDGRNIVMAESMDIVRLIDQDELLGPTGLILPGSDRTDLQDWQRSTRDLLRNLQRPRYVATGLLPEFQQLDGRHSFIRNHPVPPYSQEEWLAMETAECLSHYAEAMAKDPALHLEELNLKLVELDDILFSVHHCSPTGGISYDDIDLFSRLRSITIIKDVTWPNKLRDYMDCMAELADIPLYDEMAL